MSMVIRQKTVWSKSSVVATIFVIVLMIGVAAFVHYLDSALAIVSASVLAILIAMCVVSLYFMPREVTLSDRSLTVVFPFRSKDFPLRDIAVIKQFDDVKGLIRLCGSGAFFGWWGWFSEKGVGKFMMYASNLDHLLFMQLKDGKKYVISCSDPEQLLQGR